jgi:hypothetical protein
MSSQGTHTTAQPPADCRQYRWIVVVFKLDHDASAGELIYIGLQRGGGVSVQIEYIDTEEIYARESIENGCRALLPKVVRINIDTAELDRLAVYLKLAIFGSNIA